MEIIKAILLGIVQGLTEFLPVSSSGHLEILNHFIPNKNGLDSDLTMVVITHLGTALSILYVFRDDILKLLRSVFTFKMDDDFNLAMKIILSMIPAMFIGLLFEDQLEALFESDTLLYVGIFLCFTALVLWFTPKTVDGKEVSFLRSIFIGLSQAVAILPGVSRSGMTIATALYLGVEKSQAARFSFLMVLPIIFGKVILDVASGDLVFSNQNTLPIIAALISSFAVGVMACNWMLAIVKKSKLSYFAIYCLVVGLVVIVYSLI